MFEIYFLIPISIKACIHWVVIEMTDIISNCLHCNVDISLSRKKCKNCKRWIVIENYCCEFISIKSYYFNVNFRNVVCLSCWAGSKTCLNNIQCNNINILSTAEDVQLAGFFKLFIITFSKLFNEQRHIKFNNNNISTA